MDLFYLIEYYFIKKKCKECEKKLIFDMAFLDERICKLADKVYNSHKDKFKTFSEYKTDIGFFASTLYDTGGHTPCLVNLAISLCDSGIKHPLFISKLTKSQKKAPKAISKLEKCTNIYGTNFKGLNFAESLITLYNQVINDTPKAVILYIHTHDILMTALIHLLKENAGIKFAFFDHASHFPTLAMSLSDISIGGTDYTEKTAIEKRHIYIPQKKCALQSKKASEIKYYSKEEIQLKRQELGIPQGSLLTVSGGSSYKYFEENKSEHYEMIKRILEKIPNLYHLAITNLSDKQQNIINEIFKNSPDAKKRLMFHPLTPNYDILFQCADLFIDSFPISAALTQIDLMSMKVPTVAKINKKNPALTFHLNLPKNYPYMYEDIDKMEEGIIELLNNSEKRDKLKEDNYNFWLNNNESEVVKRKYVEYIKELINE